MRVVTRSEMASNAHKLSSLLQGLWNGCNAMVRMRGHRLFDMNPLTRLPKRVQTLTNSN